MLSLRPLRGCCRRQLQAAACGGRSARDIVPLWLGSSPSTNIRQKEGQNRKRRGHFSCSFLERIPPLSPTKTGCRPNEGCRRQQATPDERGAGLLALRPEPFGPELKAEGFVGPAACGGPQAGTRSLYHYRLRTGAKIGNAAAIFLVLSWNASRPPALEQRPPRP